MSRAHALPSALRALLGAAALGALAASCGSRFECDEQTPCDFGEQCVAGQCEVPQCSTSQQCPIDTYCAPNRECVPGCEVDTDCRPGFACDTEAGECVEDGCTDTRVDCGYREFCNVATGECYDAGGVLCRPCRAATATQDCGEGNECINGACTRDCSGGQECPAGFECYPFANDDGDIVTYQCFTYCWLYEDYEPGTFAAPPNVSGPLPLDLCPDDLPPPEAQ